MFFTFLPFPGYPWHVGPQPNMPPFPHEGHSHQNAGPQGPPMGPPPKDIPQQSAGPGLKAVDPGAIRGCKYKYTYVWTENGKSFWIWPTHIGRRSISGYRWIGYRWIYFGMDLDNISSFACY